MGKSNQDLETRVILRSDADLTAWAFQIKNTVRGKGGLEILLGTKLRPTTAGAPRNSWDEKAGQIISLISNSIDRCQIPHVADIDDDPHAMWKRLHEMNSVSGLDRSSALWERFLFTRLDMEETNAMSTHVARLRGLRAELDARKETVTKTLFIVTLLRSLPQDEDSWDLFRQSVRSDI
ncbi:hypothetical protein PENSPDRAFT_660152 [Peniophora sp. CONT]|nr:hypothetical protein PENSPDRAFT_660152 [Peniophora sp. CONT]